MSSATDHPAWTDEWPRVHGELVRYVSRLLAGDVAEAEDVAQETAVRLWQHPEVLEGDRPLIGWGRTVAHNIVVDRFRRRRSRPTEVGGVAADLAVNTPDGAGSADSVTALLSVLPLDHRTVVFEVYVRDRPVADVAATLGIPVGTVKSRCHTALRRLRDTLDPAGAGAGQSTAARRSGTANMATNASR